MKKISVLIVLCIILVPIVMAAGWGRTYGGPGEEAGKVIDQTTDGGYIVLGWTYPSGTYSPDLWIFKIDSTGNLLWSKTYGGKEGKVAYKVEKTLDGGYIMLGWIGTLDSYLTDVWLVRMDSLGDTLWTKTYGGTNDEMGLSVHQTDDEGYLIFAETESFGWGGKDIWVIKTDSLGDTLWTKTYGTTEDDELFCINRTDDSTGYIAVGLWRLYGHDACLIKFDNNGDTVWTRDYPIVYKNNDIVQAYDGGYFLVGTKIVGTHQVWISKADSLGNFQWEKIYGKGVNAYGTDLKKTSDSCYIIAGNKEDDVLRIPDAWILKINKRGDTLWTRTFGNYGIDEIGVGIDQTADNGYIVSAYQYLSDSTKGNVWLLKTDSLGLLAISEPSSPVTPSPPITHLEIASQIGSEITLHYSNCPQGFSASVYDASGRKVDEINTPNQSGTLVWGLRQNPGVYFIVAEGTNLKPTKVVLVR